MLCENPIMIKQCSHPVSCGHCVGCRQRLIRDWQLRMVHEISEYDYKALFVTLTYRNEEVPCGPTSERVRGSLSRRDLQLFFKRLRKRLSSRKECAKYQIPYGKRFKYFACGEYGGQTFRPHYHLVLLGLDSRFRKVIFDSWGKCDYPYYDCQVINSNKALAYVAGYSSKKLGVQYGRRFVERHGKLPPFQLVSIGFGRRYAERLFKRHPNACTIRCGKQERLLPRYYRKIGQVRPETLRPYIRKVIEKSAKNLTETFGISYIKALYESENNGGLMRRIRLEYCERLRRKYNQWRCASPAVS